MTPEQERWAEAIAVLRWKGDAAPSYARDRIDELRALGDPRGADRWVLLAELIASIRDAPLT